MVSLGPVRDPGGHGIDLLSGYPPYKVEVTEWVFEETVEFSGIVFVPHQ